MGVAVGEVEVVVVEDGEVVVVVVAALPQLVSAMTVISRIASMA